MAPFERPIAIRATATFKRTLGRRRRRFQYDARYSDGHVERDINVDVVLDGRRLAADVWAHATPLKQRVLKQE